MVESYSEFEKEFLGYVDEYSNYLNKLDLSNISWTSMSLTWFKDGMSETDDFLIKLYNFKISNITTFSEFFMNAPDAFKRDLIQNIIEGSYTPISEDKISSEFIDCIFNFLTKQYVVEDHQNATFFRERLNNPNILANWSGFIGNLDDDLGSSQFNINFLLLGSFLNVDVDSYIDNNYNLVLTSFMDSKLSSNMPFYCGTCLDGSKHDLAYDYILDENFLINGVEYTPFVFRILPEGYNSYARNFNK